MMGIDQPSAVERMGTGGVGVQLLLLGASNLILGLPTVLSTARLLLGRSPVEVLVAAGHGRSYGQWSRVLLRGLPGILDCGLWPAAARPARGETYALVTDIGNDLAYGVSPAELAAWVSACVARLRALDADIVLTRPPVARLASLTPWRYRLFRSLFFPRCRLSLPVMLDRVDDVNQRLAVLASQTRINLVEPWPAWYGADPIHIRRRARADAWHEILSAWRIPADRPAAAPETAVPAPRGGMAPAYRTIAGLPLRRAQPSGVLPDGSTVSLF